MRSQQPITKRTLWLFKHTHTNSILTNSNPCDDEKRSQCLCIRTCGATSTVQGTVKQRILTTTKLANYHWTRVERLLDWLSSKAHACINRQLLILGLHKKQTTTTNSLTFAIWNINQLHQLPITHCGRGKWCKINRCQVIFTNRKSATVVKLVSWCLTSLFRTNIWLYQGQATIIKTCMQRILSFSQQLKIDGFVCFKQ